MRRIIYIHAVYLSWCWSLLCADGRWVEVLRSASPASHAFIGTTSVTLAGPGQSPEPSIAELSLSAGRSINA